jgi:DNA polymerase III subunit delta'
MSFEQIRGQDKPIAILKGYLEQDRLRGGYLFIGPESVGKKMAARNLAKAANCLTATIGPCDSCASCAKIDKGTHPDVSVIENGSEDIKIESIRELQRLINYRPYEGRKKVFIIDNAHRLTAEAANAILKILEEPPQNSVLLLITDKPGLLFKTVISRCKIIKFCALERGALKKVLKTDHHISEEAAHFLSFFCEGKIGQALALKDTPLLADKNAVIDWFIFSKKNSLHHGGQTKDDVRSDLNILSTWFRDVYVLKAGMPDTEVINYDRAKDLLKAADKASFAELNNAMEFIATAMLRLDQNVNIKLLLNNMESELCRASY